MQNLESSSKPKMSEKDFLLFKKWLKSHLSHGPVTVTFNKKDGTERTMLCTTSPTFVPAHETKTNDPIDFPAKTRKVNEEVQPVFDLEAKSWRSFRWDSIKRVSISIGEE